MEWHRCVGLYFAVLVVCRAPSGGVFEKTEDGKGKDILVQVSTAVIQYSESVYHLTC